MELDHWARFAEFCHWEQKVGGPDPQIAMIGQLGQQPRRDPFWWAGMFAAVYNVAGAHMLASQLSYSDVMSKGQDGVRRWLREHWDGVPIRKERRSVRTPEKLAHQIVDYADWLGGPHHWYWKPTIDPVRNYEAAWKDIQQVYGVGRYIAIKWLEWAQRWHNAPIDLRDIRPRDAWSPRSALGTLWPLLAHVCDSKDPSTDPIVRQLSDQTIKRLAEEYNVVVTHFGLQVMLCEYRESYESRRQYPGRSHDSEMRYIREVEEYWGPQPELWAVRRELFPPEALGELQGWDGPREFCANLLADTGTTWSDLKYDYAVTMVRGEIAAR